MPYIYTFSVFYGIEKVMFVHRTEIHKFSSKQESGCKSSNSIWMLMLNMLISIRKIAKVKILVSHNVDAAV